MAKKKSIKETSNGAPREVVAQISFPDIASKTDLECRTVVEDQILVIDASSSRSMSTYWMTENTTFTQDFLSAAECKVYVRFVDNLPLELTPPKKRGEAERVNRQFFLPFHITKDELYSFQNVSPFPHQTLRRSCMNV